MDARFRDVLAAYDARARREAEIWDRTPPEQLLARRDDFLLHVGSEVGFFMHALAIARRAKRIVEIGTSYGYSTLFLADAARSTGGRVTTIDLAAAKQAYARGELERAGVADSVDWITGDALEALNHIEGPIDFVLLDAWKEIYIPCFELLLPKLVENAVIVADNMIEPAIVRPLASRYRKVVRQIPWMQSVLLPIGQGIELTCVWRNAPHEHS